MNVIEQIATKGIPYINGKPAIWDERPPLIDCLSHWRCPECSAALYADTLICLNACHLSTQDSVNFNPSSYNERNFMSRLTKDKFLDIISEERRKIQRKAAKSTGYFTECIGYEQVDGLGEEVNRLYGSWLALTELYHQIFN